MLIFGLVGAGGFGREVMSFARQSLAQSIGLGGADIETVFIDDRLAGKVVNGLKVLALDAFERLPQPKLFNVAISDFQVRRQLANRLRECADPVTLVAPNAVIGDGNAIGAGAILCAFAHITSNASIGEFFHCNIYSYVAHDCVLGDFVTFAPSVHCNGAVMIDDDAYVGTGAILRQGTPDKPLHIGRAAVIGMGSVVTKSVAANAIVMGNPAKAHL